MENEIIDFSDPLTETFFRTTIQKQLIKFITTPDALSNFETYTAKMAYIYYPTDPIKRENLIYVLVRSTIENKDNISITGDLRLLMELASKFDVLDPFKSEIRNIASSENINIQIIQNDFYYIKGDPNTPLFSLFLFETMHQYESNDDNWLKESCMDLTKNLIDLGVDKEIKIALVCGDISQEDTIFLSNKAIKDGYFPLHWNWCADCFSMPHKAQDIYTVNERVKK